MRGRKPFAYRLCEAGRQYLQAILAEGQVVQRVANRARALLALDRGERLVELAHWLGWSRMGLWHLWQHYQQYGVAAVWDAARSGRPPAFSPLERVHIERIACTDPAAYGLHLARWDCRSLQQVVVERAIVDSIYYTTVVRILATASLRPHRSRYWKTAAIDAQFTNRVAKILWRYEQAAWLDERGEVVLCLDEKPNIQALARRLPTQLMHVGQMARREFEYRRHGTVTFLVAFNVYDGTMWGCCLEANDQAHFRWALGQLARRYPHARRLHLMMDNGSSHIAMIRMLIWPIIRGCRCSIHRLMPVGSIKPNCCFAPFQISTSGALIRRRDSISSTICRPVGPSTINGLHIHSSGRGAAAICTHGPRK